VDFERQVADLLHLTDSDFNRVEESVACKELLMDRPCFLVVDREYPGSISTRKLVIETGKFNVITA
jgi:hypothetical protein